MWSSASRWGPRARTLAARARQHVQGHTARHDTCVFDIINVYRPRASSRCRYASRGRHRRPAPNHRKLEYIGPLGAGAC